MKNNLIKFLMAGVWLSLATSLRAQNHTGADSRGFSDNDLNAALGISDAWIWLQNSIVPLAMLVVFLGSIIIIAELHYRQSKILNETLRGLGKATCSNVEPSHE
jgi:hypothetical protein